VPLFSSPLSVPHRRRGNWRLLMLRRAGVFSCCVVLAARLARAATGEDRVFFSSSFDVEPVIIVSIFVFASPQHRCLVLLAG